MEVNRVARTNSMVKQDLRGRLGAAEYLGPTESAWLRLQVVVDQEASVRMQPCSFSENAGDRPVSDHAVDGGVH
jgi:hypothetical protein